jgi:uncharacterized protein YdeI (YjbR/CyaY-like superfamily)
VSPVQRPSREQVRVFRSAAEFRAWLEENHDHATELWVGYWRKGVAKTSVTYAEAVAEALCFGWIDGVAYRIDDELGTNRFTPRRRNSNWSAINIAKIAELREAGRMHPAGLRAFEERDRRRDGIYSYERPPQELPPEWLARLQADTAAWAHWSSERPAYRRTAIDWVVSAKRPETRKRRFETLLAASASGTRPRPFVVERRDR